MKSTGIVRRVDELGRVIIPIEIRRTLGIHEGDPLEIFVEDGRVCYSRYSPSTPYIDVLTSCLNNIKETWGDYDIPAIESHFHDIITLLGGEK